MLFAPANDLGQEVTASGQVVDHSQSGAPAPIDVAQNTAGVVTEEMAPVVDTDTTREIQELREMVTALKADNESLKAKVAIFDPAAPANITNGQLDEMRRYHIFEKAEAKRRGRFMAVLAAIGATAVTALSFSALSNRGNADHPGSNSHNTHAGLLDLNFSNINARKANSSTPSSRLDKIAKNPKIDTIEEATVAYHGDSIKQAAQDILGNPEAFKNVDISHAYGRYINAAGFDDRISTQNAMEAKLIGIVQDEPNARSAANLIEGNNKDAERTDTHADQINIIKNFLLDKHTKVDGNFKLNGVWGNGFVKGDKLSTVYTDFSNHRAVRITNGDKEWVFSIDSISEVKKGDCFNDVQRVTVKLPPTTKIVVEHPKPPRGKGCPTGYEKYDDRCVHKAREGAPYVAEIPPQNGTAKPTPEYKRGSAEDVVGQQGGDPGNKDATLVGTITPGSQTGGQTIGGGNGSVAGEINTGASGDYQAGSESSGSSAGTGAVDNGTNVGGGTSGGDPNPGGFN